jgi:hypothetical protein
MNPSIIVDETDLKNLDTILSDPKKLVILSKTQKKRLSFTLEKNFF